MLDRAAQPLVTAVVAELLSVPLADPFVIATGRVEATRSVLVRVTLFDPVERRSVEGLGEAAALPGVTREDQPDLLQILQERAESLRGLTVSLDSLRKPLDETFDRSPVARCGVESALLDALARLRSVPLYRILEPCRGTAEPLRTDITLPILGAERMTARALAWRARGFSCFKTKVGISLDDDVKALRAVHQAVPDATFRIDANGGYTSREALVLLEVVAREGLRVECFEQPCARDDLAGMAEVTANSPIPVVADESVRDLADLERLWAAKGAHGVNLKLTKSGGPLAAFALGRAARAHGLSLMVGGMVESRLGMTTAAHVAVALGGVEFIDLDTAFLLLEEPFEGGYTDVGDRLQLSESPGLGISLRAVI